MAKTSAGHARNLGGNAGSSKLKRFEDRFERFRQSRKRCAIVSLAFTTVLFAIAGSAWVANGVNDDWAISNLLSGNWPGEQGYCLFLNVALTQAIYHLNCLFPSFNWFFLLEGITSFAAYFAIVYLALSRLPLPFFFLAVGAMCELVLPGCTYESNFTYVSGAAGCAGCMLLLCSLAEERHSVRLVVFGIVFLLVSALWRWTMLLLCVPVFGMAALAVTLGRKGARPVGAKLARLWPFVLALALFVPFYLVNSLIWQQSDLKDWYEFNEARSSLLDYERKPYADIAEELARIGVSENDWRLLESWVHEDPEFFTAEKMVQVADVSVVRNNTFAGAVSSLLTYYKSLLTAPRMAFAFVAIVVLAACCLRGRARRWAFAIIAVTLIVASCLVVMGRLPARVRYPLWAYAAVACGFAGGAGAVQRGLGYAESTPDPGRLYRVAACASLAVPVVALAFVCASALPNEHPERLQCIFAADSFEPNSFIGDYVQAHPDDAFVMNTSTSSILMFDHLVVAPYDSALVDGTSTIGGWAARSPNALLRNAAAGVANPMKDLVDNEHAYYLSVGPNSAQMLQEYVREHYYPNAKCELVETLKNPKGTSDVQVYRFTS